MSETEFIVGKHCGITFAGLKPASLVSVRKWDGDTLRRLEKSFKGKGYFFVSLGDCGQRELVYVYHAQRLEEVLFSDDVKDFLHSFGYFYDSAEEAVARLKSRMNGSFPHEIGVFLGYPLSDVRGFIENPHGGVLCGCWKVYSNAREAAKTFERYNRCSACICRHMQKGRTLTQIFNVV